MHFLVSAIIGKVSNHKVLFVCILFLAGASYLVYKYPDDNNKSASSFDVYVLCDMSYKPIGLVPNTVKIPDKITFVPNPVHRCAIRLFVLVAILGAKCSIKFCFPLFKCKPRFLVLDIGDIAVEVR